MGKGPEILAGLQETRKQKRKYFIDITTGQIKPELEPLAIPTVSSEPQLQAMQAAFYTYD